jgi:hypothetical protein
VADPVGEDDVVTAGVEELAGAEDDAREGLGQELLARAPGAVQDQDALSARPERRGVPGSGSGS